jgi:hypothetical protein
MMWCFFISQPTPSGMQKTSIWQETCIACNLERKPNHPTIPIYPILPQKKCIKTIYDHKEVKSMGCFPHEKKHQVGSMWFHVACPHRIPGQIRRKDPVIGWSVNPYGFLCNISSKSWRFLSNFNHIHLIHFGSIRITSIWGWVETLVPSEPQNSW